MEEKKEKTEANDIALETERDYKALRTIFRGLGMSKIFSKEQENMAISRLYRLYLKAKGEYKPNEKEDKK